MLGRRPFASPAVPTFFDRFGVSNQGPRATVIGKLSAEGFRGHVPCDYIPLPARNEPGQRGAG